MKNAKKIIWGLLLIIAAILLVLNSFNVIDFELFFPGWWTLFIIVPSLADLIENKNKTDSLVSLGIGIVFLLCAQGILAWDMIWKLTLPIIIATIGIKMIFSALRKSNKSKVKMNININPKNSQKGVAVFSGTKLDFDNVLFDGVDLISVFGGVECDLRNAIIDKDCVINVACVFGGIDIKVPDNVQVINNVSCIFGGAEVLKSNPNVAHTIYIEGLCAFGGIDAQ